MKTKTLTINGKTFTLVEKRNREIQELWAQIEQEFADVKLVSGSVADIVEKVTKFINDKLITLVPGLTQDDIDDGYPSEVDDAVGAFIELNFPTPRRFGTPLMMLLRIAYKQ